MKAKVKATGKIVDGIPIYYGSEGKGYLDVPVDHDIFDRYDLEEVELLEQPSLTEGLEEAAKKYKSQWDAEHPHSPDIDFIAGAEWQKAKMPRWYKVEQNGMLDKPTQFILAAKEGYFFCTGDHISRDGYAIFVDDLEKLPMEDEK